MLYRPERGAMWDPTLFEWNGKYYMLSMHYQSPDYQGTGMWLAQSDDGVHWNGIDRVLENRGGLFKMFINNAEGGLLSVNFGSTATQDNPSAANDTMKYFTSSDMVSWIYAGENHPDDRWYTPGRWDHMYVIKEPDAYYGYIVATPRPEFCSCIGMQKSVDGIHWEVLSPPIIEWGDVPPINCLEGGGAAKIGDKYYYIGGFVGYAGSYGYNLYTFVADSPTGPFHPDWGAFRLCGFDRLPRVFIQNLATFFFDHNDLLISNAVDAGGRDEVWLLPVRKAVVKDGHIHLGWWEKNEAMKGGQIPDLSFNLVSSGGVPGKPRADWFEPAVFELGTEILYMRVEAPKGPTVTDETMLCLFNRRTDFNEGIIIEGKVSCKSAPPYDKVNHSTCCWRPARFGIFIGEGENKGSAVTLDIGHPYKRRSNIMGVTYDEKKLNMTIIDENGEDAACVRGMSAYDTHTFRFLMRRNVYEFYVDNLLVQCFVTMAPPDGKLGILLQNASCYITELKAYTMSIPNVLHEI